VSGFDDEAPSVSGLGIVEHAEECTLIEGNISANDDGCGDELRYSWS
jgi:hypothetical protein